MPVTSFGNTSFGTANTSGIGSALGGTAGSIFGGPVGSIAGSVIGSAAEGILGSVFGGGSSKAPEFDFAGTKKAQKDSINAHWKFTMKQAKKHGIHPLVAMGVNPGGSQPVYTSAKQDAANMGQNLGRSANAAIQNAFADKEIQQLQKERAHLENELLRAQISEVNRQPGDPKSGVITDPDVLVKPSEQFAQNPLEGKQKGNKAFWQEYNLGYGQSIRLPAAEELSEAMEALGHVGKPMALFEAQMKTALGKRHYDNIQRLYRKQTHPSKIFSNWNPEKYKWQRKVLQQYHAIRTEKKWLDNRKW